MLKELYKKKYYLVIFFGIIAIVIYISFNFYKPDKSNSLDLQIECPKSLSYEKELILTLNARTKNEYIEAIILGVLQDNISIDKITIKRSIYKLNEVFNRDVFFNISKEEIDINKRITISVNVRDKYGFESKKYCIYDSFELINKPNE